MIPSAPAAPAPSVARHVGGSSHVVNAERAAAPLPVSISRRRIRATPPRRGACGSPRRHPTANSYEPPPDHPAPTGAHGRRHAFEGAASANVPHSEARRPRAGASKDTPPHRSLDLPDATRTRPPNLWCRCAILQHLSSPAAARRRTQGAASPTTLMLRRCMSFAGGSRRGKRTKPRYYFHIGIKTNQIKPLSLTPPTSPAAQPASPPLASRR